jgi:serine/threonine protein kinase
MHAPSTTPVVYKLCSTDKEWVHHLVAQYCHDTANYHPHIVRLYDVCHIAPGLARCFGGVRRTGPLCTRVMVLQQVEGDLISLHGQVPATTALAHAAQALQHLHTCHEAYWYISQCTPLSLLYQVGGRLPPLLHNDIKPDNLFACRFCDGKWVVSLADFGGICHPGQTCGTYTHRYAAPEVVAERRFTQASDVFGLAASIALSVSGHMVATVLHTRRIPSQTLVTMFVQAGFTRGVASQLARALDRRASARPRSLGALERDS